MSFTLQIIVALVILSILIIIHEFGHFIIAKAVGIKVLEFSLFMGPKILHKKIGETEYTLRAIPIGGYVKMEGEESESQDERAFSNKPVWARSLVIAAGPLVNIAYTIAAFAIALYMTAGFYQMPVLSETISGYPAQQAGLQIGDRILKADDETIFTYVQLSLYVMQSQGKTINLLVERDGQKQVIPVTPVKNVEEGRFMIGIRPELRSDIPGFINYSIMQSIWFTKMTLQQVGMIFTGKASMDTLSGPVGIVNELGKAAVQEVGETVKDVVGRLINFSAMISLSLGVLNLLPIPALDGSKLVILGVEAIRRKPISPKIEAYISMAGVVFLLMIMLLVSINDISRLSG